MDKNIDIERSIIKKFRKEIWSNFTKAIKDFKLINENDKIMVCISGGKDSFLMAKCFQEIKRHGKINFDVCYVVMNPGYIDDNIKMIINNAKLMNIPIEIFETDIFDVIDNVDFKSPCYFCARMRRGHLYNKAKELGCNKIALGHHMDDIIETIMLSILYVGEYKTMMPKLHSDNFDGIDLIRPMYYIKEKDIIAWMNYNKLKFLNCACKFTIDSQVDESLSKRKEIKKLINELRKINKYVDHNILKSSDNININCILGYKHNKKYHSFLDEYIDN